MSYNGELHFFYSSGDHERFDVREARLNDTNLFVGCDGGTQLQCAAIQGYRGSGNYIYRNRGDEASGTFDALIDRSDPVVWIVGRWREQKGEYAGWLSIELRPIAPPPE